MLLWELMLPEKCIGAQSKGKAEKISGMHTENIESLPGN